MSIRVYPCIDATSTRYAWLKYRVALRTFRLSDVEPPQDEKVKIEANIRAAAKWFGVTLPEPVEAAE